MNMSQDNLFKQYEGVFDNILEKTEDNKKNKEAVFDYSPFALQDALGANDIKKIWIEYQKLRFAGIEAEELIYKLINKTRDMLAISLGVGKEDLNIKSDYPYNKSKRDLKDWDPNKLYAFYSKLVEIYHESRMKSGFNLDASLEMAILSI